MSGTLKKRTAIAGGWVAFGHIALQVIRLGGNLILTRLLVPEMFGVMAVVQLMLSAFVMFSDIGLNQNIIQSKRGEEESYLNTAWTIQILRGGGVFIISLIISITIYSLGEQGKLPEGTAYAYPELPQLLAATALTAIISGFNSIYLPLQARMLMMKRVISLEIVSHITGLILMVFLAWKTESIWSLVAGAICTSSVKMLLTHRLNNGRACRLTWDKQSASEIFHFGKWIFLSSILGYMFNNGDRILLGGFVTAETLGIYAIAFFLANAGKELLSRIISSVFFPALSECVREYPDRLKRIYYNIKVKVDALVMFTIGVLYPISGNLVNFLYDDRYESAGFMFQILSLSLVSTGFIMANQCFLANGRSRTVTMMNAIQVISLFVIFPVMFNYYGMKGALWALVIVSIIRIVVASFFMKKYFFFDFKKEMISIPFGVIGYAVGTMLNSTVFKFLL